MIAGLVIETAPETAQAVAGRLGSSFVVRTAESGWLAVTWYGADGDELEELTEELLATDPDILDVRLD